jgi:hypothetical protein
MNNSREALRLVEGQEKATQYLGRLQTEQVNQDELAVTVAALYGSALRGFCAAIEKALRTGGGNG